MSRRSTTQVHPYWGVFSDYAALPNVAGSPTQSLNLEVGDQAFMASENSSCVCIVATLGAAEWKSDLTSASHPLVRQLIHLADGVGGPMEGWSSGAVRDTLPPSDPFPTQVIWWTDVTRTKVIVSKLLVYGPGLLPTTIQWSVYAADGVTIIAVATDTVTYSGPFETSRTRVMT